MAKISFGSIWDDIQKVRQEKGRREAIKLANKYIAKDVYCAQAYMQLIDMYYSIGEMEKAEKPIDFILSNKLQLDGVDNSLLYYIKAVLLSEKTEWKKAKEYIKKAIKMNPNNPEYVRILATIEFWSGNKTKAYELLKNAGATRTNDADILLDLVTMALDLGYVADAKKYVKTYFENKDNITFLSRAKSYYDKKMDVFKKFLFGN